MGMGVWRREEQKEQHRWNTGKWKDGKVIKQRWENDLDQGGETEVDQRRNGIEMAEDKESAGDRGVG
jgi:hypothetical protein